MKKYLILFATLLMSVLFTACSSQMTGEEIYNKLLPSTVEIYGEGNGFSSTGSGFFIDDAGTVVTNYHVIEGCTEVSVTTSAGSIYTVKSLLGYDQDLDIAILSTSCNSLPVEIHTGDIKTGEAVFALGSSEALTGTFSEGIISASERSINGVTYIQTTAPVSHGNSGGPLINSNGQVIGIVSAGLEEGQNINFAIPISAVNSIDKENPVSLAEIFKTHVEWLSEWQVWYEPECNCYILVFELADENEVPVSCKGTTYVQIIDNDGTTIFEGDFAFTENDFDYWYYENDTIQKYQACIYIDAQDVLPSTSSQGTLYFTVSGDDFFFEETSMNIYELPILPTVVKLPELPLKLNHLDYYGKITTTVQITDISYEIINGDSLYMYFTGEKTYEAANTYDESCGFQWKLYDAEGYLIDHSSAYISGLETGDKFKNYEGYSFYTITPGQSYTLELLDY